MVDDECGPLDEVIEAMVKLKFLRPFGRVGAGEKSQGWSCGEGEEMYHGQRKGRCQ